MTEIEQRIADIKAREQTALNRTRSTAPIKYKGVYMKHTIALLLELVVLLTIGILSLIKGHLTIVLFILLIFSSVIVGMNLEQKITQRAFAQRPPYWFRMCSLLLQWIEIRTQSSDDACEDCHLTEEERIVLQGHWNDND